MALPSSYCSYYPDLPCLSPEPFASKVDIFTAAQELEKAIHASTKKGAEEAMKEASNYLQYAHDYLASVPYPQQATEVITVKTALDNLSSELQTVPSAALGTFQHDQLYGFQGVLYALYEDVSTLSA